MVHNSQRQTTEYCATYLPTASFLSSSCKLPFSLWASWWIVVSDGPQNDCVITSTCTINVKSCDSMLDHLLHVTHAWFYSLDEYRWTITPLSKLAEIFKYFMYFHQIFNRFCDSAISEAGLLACGSIPNPWYNTVPTSSHWSDQKWPSSQPWWENWDGQWESRMDIRSETVVQAQTRNSNANTFWPRQWCIQKRKTLNGQ